MTKIVFLGTGGTIAGLSIDPADCLSYRSAQIPIAELLEGVPLLQTVLNGHDVAFEQVLQIDSKDMDFPHWVQLADRAFHHLSQPDVVGLVITHGTDTLEETAFFLSRVLPADCLKNKAVVMTCAMRPASSPDADGPQNLLDAAAVACTQDAKGVVVVCAGEIHGALDVQKIHAHRLNAFDSGDADVIGRVAQGSICLLRSWPEAPAIKRQCSLAFLAKAIWPRVEIVMSHAGASGAHIRALCNRNLAEGDAPVRGIVVAGTGNATVHADLEAALQHAQSQGIRIVRSTRCAWGHEAGTTLSADAPEHSQGLSAVKARIALMLELKHPS